MQEDTPHRGQLSGVCPTFALDALSVGFHRDRIRTHLCPPPHVAHTIADSRPHRSNGVVSPVELPEAILADHDAPLRQNCADSARSGLHRLRADTKAMTSPPDIAD
jgi:hypothetical protein